MQGQGILVVFEGIDGCGKSTLSRMLADLCNKKQRAFVFTKEPGGTSLGRRIRSLVQERDCQVSSLAEYFLFAADRAQHLQEVVIPSLAGGRIVISDRMADSSLAYQGYGRGLSIAHIMNTHAWIFDGIKPNVIFYLRLDPAVAYQRLCKRGEALTAFEREQPSFFTKVAEGFDTIFKQREDVVVLDATQSLEELFEQVESYMKRYWEHE
jgi:dTMP kinase